MDMAQIMDVVRTVLKNASIAGKRNYALSVLLIPRGGMIARLPFYASKD